MIIDLHCHSTCSDGRRTPSEVASLASAANLAWFALTDHDTCEGSASCQASGARNIRGVEISCNDEQNQTVHILAYDTGGDWASLEQVLLQARQARVARLRMMAAKLRQRGIDIDVEPLIAASHERSVGRPDLARAMVAIGAVTSEKEAFNRHLYDGGPVNVPHRALTVAAAIDAAIAAGAKLSLAHPHLYGDRTQALVARFRDRGLTGIEAFYRSYTLPEQATWRALAARFQMACTGGSDSHGEPDTGYGVTIPDDVGAALGEWLTTANAA